MGMAVCSDSSTGGTGARSGWTAFGGSGMEGREVTGSAGTGGTSGFFSGSTFGRNTFSRNGGLVSLTGIRAGWAAGTDGAGAAGAAFWAER